VFSTPDLLNVFNYPNPFKNDTYFTFELHGVQPPEEFKIKVFTVAGRLIRDFSIPQSNLKIGFNRFYWDGRDQDGDEIANGVYFYKIASKNNGIYKTVIEKLAKIK
jgi:flagellar hook assembly protein FlgD